jgi:hypothetical protein
MKTKKQVYAIAICISCAAQLAQAEMRTWVDSDGTKLNAELIEHINGKVTLRDENGKTGTVSISALSADDQKYVLKHTPPELKIDVVEITDRKNTGFGGDYGSGFQIQSGSTQYKVKLIKNSTIPYTGIISAEIYIIGLRQVKSEHVLLDKTVHQVSFKDRGSDKVELMSGTVNVGEFDGGADVGLSYDGYLVVLVDAEGRVFQMEGSRSKYEEHARMIRQKKKSDIVEQSTLLPLRRRAY